jgi:hypothetical protein
MQYSERLELLISMKERANGLIYRSCDEETAHNVVNEQSESKKHGPFSTEQARIEMSRVIREYNREIELGDDIYLDHLLTKLANVFLPELISDEADSLQTALHAVMSHGPTFHRRGEQTERQPEPENYKTYKAKRKQDVRESQSDVAPWERVLRAIYNFKSDLGGLRESVNEQS